MTKATVSETWLTPDGALPTGNWPKDMLVRFVPDDALAALQAQLAAAVEVALARLGGESCPSIAKHYGISESLPREIVKGRTWPDASKEAHAIYNGVGNG